MYKKSKIIAAGMIAIIGITGCSTQIQPDSKSAGTYSTQTPMSSLEYSIYMNKAGSRLL